MPLLVPQSKVPVPVVLSGPVYARVQRSAQLAKMTVPDWVAHHLAAYFSLPG